MGRGSPILILWLRNQHRNQLTFNVFGSTVSYLFTVSKVRKFYQILNSLPLFLSLMVILPVSHQPDCSKTVTSRKEALIQITNLRKDAFIKEVYRCELKKGSTTHHQPTWILHQHDQAHTRGLVPSIPIHFLSDSWLLLFRLHSSTRMKLQKDTSDESIRSDIELMPTTVCSTYHTVCLFITVCHCCRAWLPPAGTPFILQAQDAREL